jgi:hypothetical protein
MEKQGGLERVCPLQRYISDLCMLLHELKFQVSIAAESHDWTDAHSFIHTLCVIKLAEYQSIHPHGHVNAPKADTHPRGCYVVSLISR